MMKKIFMLSLVALATTAGIIVSNQPAQAHRRYYYRHRIYPLHRLTYCYPVTHWFVDQDPGYHPRAYVDGYRQGHASVSRGDAYKPRTAGGEFGRGFDDGYYGREFANQQKIVPNLYRPYTTSQCGWF